MLIRLALSSRSVLMPVIWLTVLTACETKIEAERTGTIDPATASFSDSSIKLSIVEGAVTNKDTVSLAIQCGGARDILLSRVADCSQGSWTTCQPTLSWDLEQQDTTVNIYAQFRNLSVN